MPDSDIAFTGSIAENYDLYLRPILFEPYARDLARRAAELQPHHILEIAAGTGVVTAALRASLTDAEIVATDLNQAMLDVAARRLAGESVELRPMDAQALDFPEARFDLVICQFGVMFFPDRIGAYREVRRVLKPGGHFLFNVWGPLEENAVSAIVARAVQPWLGGDSSFVERVPFGYHDRDRVESDLRAAGFEDVRSERVGERSRFGNSRDAASGLCLGSPLRSEIEARAPGRMDELIGAIEAALAPYVTDGALDAPMSAMVFRAR